MVNEWTVFYGVTTLVMLAATFVWGDRNLRWASVLIAASYALSNISMFSELPDGSYYPVMDFGLGLVFLRAWTLYADTWLLVVTLLFIAMLVSHDLYFVAESFGRYTYQAILNALFLSQELVIISAALLSPKHNGVTA